MWGRGTPRAHCTPNALGQRGGRGQHERCQSPEMAVAGGKGENDDFKKNENNA